MSFSFTATLIDSHFKMKTSILNSWYLNPIKKNEKPRWRINKEKPKWSWKKRHEMITPRLMKCIYIGTGHPISTQIFCNVCIICPAVCRPPAILRESRQHAREIVTRNSWLLSHRPHPTANDQQKSSATGLQWSLLLLGLTK